MTIHRTPLATYSGMADAIIDMGPGAGAEGGRVVFEGAPRELLKASKSLTGQHLAVRLG
jgi:excinuclease UvrABC ATPase subunit